MATGITAATAIQAIAAGAAVAGTAVSIDQQRKASAASKKADAASRAAAEISTQRSNRKNIVRARVAQAQLIASGGASGITGSSSLSGAIGGVGSTAAGQRGFARTQQAGNAAFQNQQSRARGFQSNAAIAGQVANLPGQFGFDIGSIFKEKTDASDGIA